MEKEIMVMANAILLEKFHAKIIQMCGKELCDKWIKEHQQRQKDFEEFLKTKNLTLDYVKKIREEITEEFGNKEQISPDKVKELYVNFLCEVPAHYPFHSEEFLKKIEINKNAKILDFGSGIGQELFNLEKKGYANLHYYEVNLLSKEFVRFLIKKYNSIVKIIKEPEKEYDLIMSFDVMEHIPNYKEVYEDLFKRLKVGGIFINGYHFTPKGTKGSVYHYEETYPVKKLFHENGFEELASTNGYWRKKWAN